jgi:hypothetical protein
VLQQIIEAALATKSLFSLNSGCHSKQAADEGDLTYDVSFISPSHLPFPHYVHDLISPARVCHALSKGKKPSAGLTRRLMKQ